MSDSEFTCIPGELFEMTGFPFYVYPAPPETDTMGYRRVTLAAESFERYIDEEKSFVVISVQFNSRQEKFTTYRCLTSHGMRQIYLKEIKKKAIRIK